MFSVKIPRNVHRRIGLWAELGKENQKLNEKVSRELALEARRRIRAHIDQQDLNWKPINPEYKEAKKAAGLSDKIWEATKFLRNHIRIIKVKTKNFVGYNVGFEPTDIYPGTNTPVGLVAKVLEYGSPSRNIVPRPLFRVVRAELLKSVKEFTTTYKNEFIKSIIKKLKR